MAAEADGSTDAMFNVTSRFREAVTCVNTVDGSKFPLLLARIVGKVGTKSGGIFSAAESTQLEGLLSITAAQLSTLLEGCSYIVEQAAYHQASPEDLKRQLVEAGVDEDKSETFERVWAGEGAALIKKLRNRPMGTPSVLDSTKWQLHLQLGQSGLTRAKDARAMFEFGLKDATTAEGEGADDSFKMEMSHDQLYEFFQKIELIQQQLDSLSA